MNKDQVDAIHRLAKTPDGIVFLRYLCHNVFHFKEDDFGQDQSDMNILLCNAAIRRQWVLIRQSLHIDVRNEIEKDIVNVCESAKAIK